MSEDKEQTELVNTKLIYRFRTNPEGERQGGIVLLPWSWSLGRRSGRVAHVALSSA